MVKFFLDHLVLLCENNKATQNELLQIQNNGSKPFSNGHHLEFSVRKKKKKNSKIS